jgi:hypothetical protein
VHFSATAARYVRIPGGELTRDLTRLLEEPLRSNLSEGLGRIREGARSWDSPSLEVSSHHGQRRVTVHVEQFNAAGLILVVLDDREPPASPPVGGLTECPRHLPLNPKH